MSHYHIKLRPQAFILAIIILALYSFVSLPGTVAIKPQNSLSLWITNNWPLVGLVISEALAFVPSKFAGISKAVYSFISDLFKKKNSNE